ncbi:hypothetical protein B5S30_g4044 [[Candida] boidinii]|nr:hypothetical protein B5S30_g4044 [[Candida] boidinii]GMF98183.1 unnamed protein product [[Candida] boidinii]
MFDSITSLIGAYVSIVYPLLETYKILEFYYNSNSKNDMIDQLTQTINLINSKLSSDSSNNNNNNNSFNSQTTKNPTLKDYNKWLTYWIIIYLFTLFKNSIFIKPIINLLPFYNFFELYFKIWLVYPIISSNYYNLNTNTNTNLNYNNNSNNKDIKVNGSYIIYKYYLSPNLTALSLHISSINIADLVNLLISLYNVLVNKYVPAGLRNMVLIDQPPQQQQQQQKSRSSSNQQRQSSSSSAWKIPVPLQSQQNATQQTATTSSVSALVSEIFSKSYGVFISTPQNEDSQSSNFLSSFVTVPSQSTDGNQLSKSPENKSLLSTIYPKVLLTSLVSPLFTFFDDESHDGTNISPTSSSSSLSSSSSSTTRFVSSLSTASGANSRSPSNNIPQNLRNVSGRQSQSNTENYNNINSLSNNANNFKNANRSFEEFDVVVKEDIMEPLNIDKLRKNKYVDQKNRYGNDYDEDESLPLMNKSNSTSTDSSTTGNYNTASGVSTGSKRVGSNPSSSWFKWKNNSNNINLNDSNSGDRS